MTDDAKREKDASRVDTVRPPPGGDAYTDQTVVRTVPPELLTISKGAPRPRPKKAAPARPAPPGPADETATPRRKTPTPARQIVKLYSDEDDEPRSSEAAVVSAPPPQVTRPKRKRWFDMDLLVVFIFTVIAVIVLGWIAGRP